jgi:hypothetical protein
MDGEVTNYPVAIVGLSDHHKAILRAAFGPAFVYLTVGESWGGYRFSGAVIYEPGPTGSDLMDEANAGWLRLFRGLKLMPGAKTVTITQ